MEKQFPPSLKKLQDLRKKGDVPKSIDLPGSAVICLFVVSLALMGHLIWNTLGALIVNGIEMAFAPTAEVSIIAIATLVLKFLFLPLLVAGIVGTSISFLIVGPVFSAEPITPKFKKLNPVDGLKKMFSGQQFVGLIKGALAVLVLLTVFWLLLRYNLKVLANLAYLAPDKSLSAGSQILLFALIVAAVTGLIIGTLEFATSRFFYVKKNKMTREEVERENKEQMGNPQIKGRRRQIAFEDMENDAVRNTSGAELMIVNPTHIAIAIKGEGKNKDVPVVVAKGRGITAQRMREKALQEGIPIVRNRALARNLFVDAKIRALIPKEYLAAVNQTLAWVRKMEVFKKQQLALSKKAGSKKAPVEVQKKPDHKKT